MAIANPQVSISEKNAVKKSVWLFNPTLDILGLGGLTFIILTALIVCGSIAAPTSQFAWIPVTFFFVSVLVNYPHYAATYYRVYRDAAEVRKYPMEAILAPIVLLLLAIPGFYYPAAAVGYAYLYYLVTGYHYSGQTYGVSMIFMGKAGVRLKDWQKKLFMFPIYATFLFTVIYQNTQGFTPIEFYDIHIPVLGLPVWIAQGALLVSALGLLGYVWLNVHLSKVEGTPIPPATQMIYVTHLVWFTLGNFYPMFFLFIPFLHCLQYLMVTTYCDYREVAGKKKLSEWSVMAYCRSADFFRYYGIQVAIGTTLFFLIPFGMSKMGVASFPLASVMIVTFLNLHHFILDGAIWKLRKPEVAKQLM